LTGLGLDLPGQQVFAKGLQFAGVRCAGIDQQHHIDVAGWKAIDQTGQQLQFKLLHGHDVAKNQIAFGCALDLLVAGLRHRELGQNAVEHFDQFGRVG
jgi:hypothetical protein